MSKIKIGLIGCGNISGAHVPGYLKHTDKAEIKYFCDLVEDRAKEKRDSYGSGEVVTDYHVILNDPEIDGVDICVPNGGHMPISVDALKAGKHVLCEKPAARIYSEAQQMLEAQKESGKTLNIGVVTRFSKGVEGVRRLIQNGELGEIYHVFCSFREFRSIPGLGGPFTTKSYAGGGCLIDWGVHRIDQMLYMTGDPEPVTVSAEVFSKLGVDMKNYMCRGMWSENTSDRENGTYDVDESCTLLIRTTGPVFSLHGAWAQNIDISEQYVDIMGTKAGVRLNYCGDYTVFYPNPETGEFLKTHHGLTNDDMFRDEIGDYLNCIATGEKSRADITNAIKTSKIMQAAYDSSEKHREIVL